MLSLEGESISKNNRRRDTVTARRVGIAVGLLVCIALAACTRRTAPPSEHATQHVPNQFRLGPLPDATGFLKLTEIEAKFDSAPERKHARAMEHIADGSYFLQPPSDAEKQAALQSEQDKYRLTLRYRNNRARILYQRYKNGILQKNELEQMPSGFPLFCTCSLEPDGAIKLESNFWVFGGLAFNLRILKSSDVTGDYWEDTHKERIYKAQRSDTELVDNVRVALASRELVLVAAPSFTAGEVVTGVVSFRTNPYYRARDYEPGFGKEGAYSDEGMDSIYLTGTVTFTCQVLPYVKGVHPPSPY